MYVDLREIVYALKVENGLFYRALEIFAEFYNHSDKNPDHEVLAERKRLKSPCLCRFQDLEKRRKLHLYIKLTSNDAGFCAEMKKSHNFIFKTLRGQHLSRSFLFYTMYPVANYKFSLISNTI